MATPKIIKKIARYFLMVCFTVVLISILLVLPLKWLNPSVTAFTLRDDSMSYHLTDYWVEYESVSPQILMAVIAAEDQKFPNHMGLDFQSIRKSIFEKRAKVRGASTISQQLIKNIYLWPGRSYIRKGVEAWLTLWMELLLPKKRILEIYVNVVEYGPGVYGVGKASQQFFGHKPKAVNQLQASLLAAVLPQPKSSSVTLPSSYLIGRASDIRRSIRALGGVGYLQEINP
jgi:monofunctional biosynthetic peptidoglycan transglycosylase